MDQQPIITPARPDPAAFLQPNVAVSVRGVSMTYAGKTVVDDVTFDLAPARYLTILGPSGSGKTTLLRMIAGFQNPSRGEIAINALPVAAVPPHRRSIGMVFQKLALFPHLTAAGNVAFPLKMRRFDARTIPERVARYLDLVKLADYGRRRINELSGGQQQRVAIARALVFEPDLLLLDEPLAALDRKLREEMQLEFRRIQKDLGVTTINVTHDQREALVVSDEVVVMDQGRIQQIADPTSTYRRPANPFVAGFIGVTNKIEGSVRQVRGDCIEMQAHGRLLAGAWAANAAEPEEGAPVQAALRAEQVRIAAQARTLDGLDNVLDGDVTDVIFEGERVVYEVRVAALGDGIVRVFDHDPEAHSIFTTGTAVALGWNRRDMLVFA